MFRMPKPAAMDLNLAPMVDVMMCLIIFFLIASEIVSAENLKKLVLPDAAAAETVDKSELGWRVTINVLPGSEDGGTPAEYVVGEWDGQQVVQRERTPEELDELLAAHAKRAEQAGQQLRCVIRADREARYAEVEVVMRAAAKAKIANLVFAAEKVSAEEAGP